MKSFVVSSPRLSHRLKQSRCIRCSVEKPRRIRIEGGESILLPEKKTGYYPRLELTKEEAVQLQLQALRQNGVPYPDHGVEVMYRFANIDPFERSKYFGVMTDLGQFERFRRLMHTPAYAVLINHTDSELISSLQVSEYEWKQRVHVTHAFRLNETAIFVFTMIQKFGGCYDAYFFTDSLLRE